MKTTSKLIVTGCILGLASMMMAQEGPRSEGKPGGPGAERRGPAGVRVPRVLLIHALDANRDRVIDADEIAGASAALKKLDLDGDGRLSTEEFAGRPMETKGPRSPRKSSRGPKQESKAARS